MPRTAPLLLALASLFGRNYGQSAHQPETHHSVPQGEAVQLNCKYKTSGANYLYWYVQYPDKALEMLLYNFGDKIKNGFTEVKRGFTAKLENSDTYNLYKEAAELSDSGVYFCAVSDTVTYLGLTAGSGTRGD
uniref:Ig-like domain-containing protein n=1 Tax=Xenopus tropicalis TaxID=8364 RepID=A0A6I8SML9_XENTR